MNTKDRIYDFIVQYTKEHLYPPSFKEICEGVHLRSKSSIYDYIHKLEKEGRIKIGDFHQPRCIKIVGYQLVKIEGEGT